MGGWVLSCPQTMISVDMSACCDMTTCKKGAGQSVGPEYAFFNYEFDMYMDGGRYVDVKTLHRAKALVLDIHHIHMPGSVFQMMTWCDRMTLGNMKK